MEFGIGERITGDAVPLQNRQGGLDRVEKGHRAGAACFQIDFLWDLRENDMGRHIFLRDAIAAHGDGIEEDAPRAVRRGAGRKAAVDLLDAVGHALDGFAVGDVFLDDLKARLFVVHKGDLAGLTGAECHRLLCIAHDVRLGHGFLPYHINICGDGREGGGTVHPRGDRGRIAAGNGLNGKHRAGNRFAAHGIALGDLHVGLFIVDCRDGVLVITLSYIYVHALRRGINTEAVRCGGLDKAPKAGRGILNIDLTLCIGNVAADDLTVKVDAETCAGETSCGSTGSFLQHDLANASRRRGFFSTSSGFVLSDKLAGTIIVEE